MSARNSFGAAIALVACLSCFSERNSVTGPSTGGDCSIPTSAFGRNKAIVIMRNFSFAADTVRIRAGGTVTWVNCEPATVEPHTTTSTTGVWDSNFMPPGSTFERVFPNTGTFPYFCIPHPSMRGVVIVEP